MRGGVKFTLAVSVLAGTVASLRIGHSPSLNQIQQTQVSTNASIHTNCLQFTPNTMTHPQPPCPPLAP